MATRKDEPISAQPAWIGWIVPQDPLEEQVRGGRQAHRRPRMTRPGLLDRVHREHADEVNGPLVSG